MAFPRSVAARIAKLADDQTPTFRLLERADFAEPGDATLEQFEALAEQVLPGLEQSTGVSLLASGVSDDEIWGIWDMPTVQSLWDAMRYTSQDANYAQMQSLIRNEQQDFYYIWLEEGDPTQKDPGYRYARYTDTASAVQLNEKMVEFEELTLDPNVQHSWAAMLVSETGQLYVLEKIWRCVTDDDTVSATASDGTEIDVQVWNPGSYEES